LAARRGGGAWRRWRCSAGAGQSVVHPRGPRTAVVGGRGRDRQEPEPEFRRPHPRNREAQEALVDSLKKIKGLEVRVVEAGQADGETDGTRLFGALSSALSTFRSIASPAPS
jgi:hypothetical protein